MKKSIITLGIILAGVCSAGSISYASVSKGYTGPIDPITGEPLGGDDSNGEYEEDTTQQTEIPTSDGSLYNVETGMYSYLFQNGRVECSVANGMIVTDEVSMNVDGRTGVSLYKDGNLISDIPDTVSTPGNYMFIAGDVNSKSQLLGFRIINSKTGTLDQYIMPDGFYVDTVMIDGIERYGGFNSVDMTEEGFYEINYINSDTQVEYTLKVTVDHTPPQVTFKGLGKDNKAKGPVTVKGLTEDDVVSVTYNGEKSSLDMYNRVKDSGKYKIIVTDSAGNRVEKSFTILLYLNLSSSIFLAILLAIIVGVCIALLVTRKRLRVR